MDTIKYENNYEKYYVLMKSLFLSLNDIKLLKEHEMEYLYKEVIKKVK